MEPRPDLLPESPAVMHVNAGPSSVLGLDDGEDGCQGWIRTNDVSSVVDLQSTAIDQLGAPDNIYLS